MASEPTPSASALAAWQGVRREFDGHVALEGLDLEVRPGEVLALLGPNGAGKTTAVRILCGLLKPTAGRAQVGGHDVQTEPLAARRRFGFVPDGAPLYAQLPARAHLDLVGQLHGLDADTLEERATRLLGGFDLAGRALDPVGGFSRGMRQKLAIACALLPEPDLLILDEPLTGLDAPSTATIKELLQLWVEGGRSVLYTSHLLDVVERVADRMAVLDSGQLVAVGTLDELQGAGEETESLERVFRTLTRADDPAAAAGRLLGRA